MNADQQTNGSPVPAREAFDERTLVLDVRPEVRDFVARVRTRLADLDVEEQRDLTDGLEADLSDLVAERGPQALGDPDDYARELRAAAGLSPVTGKVAGKRSVGERTHAVLDGAHEGWDRAVAALPGNPMEFLSTLRPAWWLMRAWVAVQTIDLIWGNGGLSGGITVIPTLGDLGFPLLVVAIVISVQIGRGKWWPGNRTQLASVRTLLLGLNGFALLMAPVAVQGLMDNTIATAERWYGSGDGPTYDGPGTDRKGLYVDGTWVSNIYPYDAAGKPLVGVQLFTQQGKPLNVVAKADCVKDDASVPHLVATDVEREQAFNDDMDCESQTGDSTLQRRVWYPWLNGTTQVQNAFPMPSRFQLDQQPSSNAFTEPVPPAIGGFPQDAVAPITLPGITPSTQVGSQADNKPDNKPESKPGSKTGSKTGKQEKGVGDPAPAQQR